jgi:hypothetical protein
MAQQSKWCQKACKHHTRLFYLHVYAYKDDLGFSSCRYAGMHDNTVASMSREHTVAEGTIRPPSPKRRTCVPSALRCSPGHGHKVLRSYMPFISGMHAIYFYVQGIAVMLHPQPCICRAGGAVGAWVSHTGVPCNLTLPVLKAPTTSCLSSSSYPSL